MQKIRSNFQGHYRELVLGPSVKLFEAVLELFVPIVMASMIDGGIATGDRRYIVVSGLILLGLGILGFGAAMVCQYYAAAASGAIGRSLRGQVYAHVMKLSGREAAAFGAGGLITRLTSDVNHIQTGINMGIRLGSRVPFLAVGSVIMALRINFQAGIVFLLATPLIVLVLFLVMRGTLPGYGLVQAMQDRLSRQSAESLAGMRVIRAFSRQDAENEAFEETADLLTEKMIRVGRISALLNPLTSVIAGGATVAIVWICASLVLGGQMLSGEIIALVSYMTQTLLALIVAANLVVLFTRALASARRVNAVLETEPSIAAQGGDASPYDSNAPLLAFDNVRFAYHKGAEDALSGITFSIKRGETVGLIGGTGSGKTTLVNLVMRYYDADEGTVSVNGRDIKTLSTKDLRRRVGLTPQKAVLFAGTVRHNLAIAAPTATDEDMWRALEVAQGADFVKARKDGLDTLIHEGGQNLSGGQRQRLTIARALVREPALLILDDAASALDYATDAALRKALRAQTEARPDMGVLLISQRAASLIDADRILVLDDGRQVGIGTHAQLLSGCDVYREICRSQGIWDAEGTMAAPPASAKAAPDTEVMPS